MRLHRAPLILRVLEMAALDFPPSIAIVRGGNSDYGGRFQSDGPSEIVARRRNSVVGGRCAAGHQERHEATTLNALKHPLSR